MIRREVEKENVLTDFTSLKRKMFEVWAIEYQTNCQIDKFQEVKSGPTFHRKTLITALRI